MITGILGGGLSGVVLQHFLERDSEILEKESRIGGLCRTFEKDGFSYDIGGHILFSKNQKVLKIIRNILGDNINYVRRNNKILYKGRYVKYPFENELGALDTEEILHCLLTYLQNHPPKPKNFRQWLYYTFGDGIAEKYLIPYNKKIWKTPPENMGLQWVQRVPKPPLEDILKSALGIETEGYIHQLNFNYPRNGGIENLVHSFAKGKSRITTNFEVKKIRGKNGQWIVSDGICQRFFDRLVLTIPVQEAIKALENVPVKVTQAACALRYNSVRVVLIGINNESLMDKSAVYIPAPDVIAHRVCFMGYFSKNTVPAGKSSLIAEITTNPSCPDHHISDDSLIEKVANDLEKVGLIKKKEIVTTDVVNAKYAYVVYDLDYHRNLKIIKDYFKSTGIVLLGRFAQFEYINTDEVIRRSRELALTINRN